MERDVHTQLRITPWPPGPLPLPPVARLDYHLDNDGEVLIPRIDDINHVSHLLTDSVSTPQLDGSLATWFRPSGETYLRLADVDLEDPEAILGFANRYGLLGGALAYARLRSTDLFEQYYAGQLQPRHEWSKALSALRSQLLARQPKLASLFDGKRGSSWEQWLSTVLGHVPPVIETLTEFRFAARCLRDLYSAWRMFKDRCDVTEFEWVSPCSSNQFTSIHQPASLLGGNGALSAFLSDFTPHLGFSWCYTGPAQVEHLFAPADEVSVEFAHVPGRVPLHAVLALELFNHIVENAEYHICANERCRRTFVHQEGRSKKQQRRSRGVLYCTAQCARATAQREYRRKRAAGRTTSP
jgi:hypothetical protein